jgi:hypothetical protein
MPDDFDITVEPADAAGEGEEVVELGDEEEPTPESTQ